MNKVLGCGIAALALVCLASFAGAAQTPSDPAPQTRTAIFAGGNFWCMEPPFEALDGVLAVTTGYSGGHTANPTFEQVTAGGSGHAEAVLVSYDPARIGYQQLLDTFWRNIDPTDGGGQFIDRGKQFRPAIFYADEEQRQLAESSKKALDESWRFAEMFSVGRIVVEITPAGSFYPAEEEHQDYAKKNPLSYRYYRWNSGRDNFLDKYWGKSAK
jgi:methionine-S-sulfoxide reductase